VLRFNQERWRGIVVDVGGRQRSYRAAED
jgi:hypothetical protein